MKLFLVRHARTKSNELGVYAGRNSEPYVEDSRKSIAEMVHFVSRHNPRKIVSSPLERTRKTAKEIAKALRLKIEIAEDLVEMDFGDWTGKTGNEISEIYPDTWRKWRRDPFSTRPEGGESLTDVQRRMIGWLNRQDVDGPDLAVVTHESVIKSLLCMLSSRGDNYYREVTVPNCSVQLLSISSKGKMSVAENVFIPSL